MAFCTNCGKKLTDGAAFCVYCGTKIIDMGDSSGSSDKPPKSKPKWLLPAIIAFAVLALAAVAIFIWPGISFENDGAYCTFYDTDGNVHFAYDNGTTKTFEGDYDAFYKSSYVNGYIVLEDGELYTVNKSMKKRNDISDSCDDVFACYDNYILYIEDGNTVIYDLKSEDSTEVSGKAIDYMHYGTDDDDGGNIAHIFFSTDDNTVWHFDAAEFDTEMIADLNTEFNNIKDSGIIYCSNDGELMFYSVLNGATDTLFVWENGKVKELDSVEFDNTYYEHSFSEYYSEYAYYADCAIIGNYDSDMFIMVNGDDFEEIDISGAFTDSVCLDGADSLYNYDGTEVPDKVYIVSSNGTYDDADGLDYTLWSVDFDGKVKEICKVAGSEIAVFGDTIYYMSGEDELSCGTLSGNKVKNSVVIDDEVLNVQTTDNSVYYLKNVDMVDEENNIGEGNVYRINPELKEPVKIDKKASCDYYSYEFLDEEFNEFAYLNWCGIEAKNNVLMYHDLEFIDKDEYKWEAALYACDMDGDGTEKLIDDALGYGYISFENGTYLIKQYVKTKSDRDIVNIYFYDGKEAKLVLEDVWAY